MANLGDPVPEANPGDPLPEANPGTHFSRQIWVPTSGCESGALVSGI